MKSYQIRAAVPLLDKRDRLLEYIERAQGFYAKASLTVDDTCGRPTAPLSIPSHAAQAIIQSMIDGVEADLRALGVDLSDA